MKKIFLKIISLFSLFCMFIFNVNTNGILSMNKLFSFIENNKKPKNVISIAMATDNNYAYPTIVAMTSILENRKPNTNINFYIMLSGDFEQLLKYNIKSLENRYKKCSINFINMQDKLKDLYTSGHIKTATYYRLLLPNLLPNLDKILYMDVDTITLKDLSDLFNINIDDYYLAGCKDLGPEWISENCIDYVNKFGKEDCLKNYINAGILLFNLKKMREDKLVKKLVECASSHNFTCHDQDTLNWVCHDKIKKIDNIYNSYPDYIGNNLKYQAIIHYVSDKPWNNQDIKYADLWWNYAKKTGLGKLIKSKFLNKFEKTNTQSKEIKNIIDIIKRMKIVA